MDEVKNKLNKEESEKKCDAYISESCENCVFFDGYDVCLNAKNFGSVTTERKTYCNNNNLFETNML